MPSAEVFADRPHGTRLRYISRCRCVPCRAANSRYETARAAARRAGDWRGIVPADTARAHLLRLSRLGVGYKSVAAAGDVTPSILFAIRTGARKRIRASTERAILAVDEQAIADHALVSPAATWRRIRALLEEGFSKAELARRLGYKTPKLQLGRPGRRRILAATAAKIERFYRLMVDESAS
jgi:hypothetical protein